MSWQPELYELARRKAAALLMGGAARLEKHAAMGRLNARQALDLGLVSELLPRERLADRALELAEQLARKPDMLLRHTRTVLIQPLRQAIERDLQHFMALECLAAVDRQ